MDYLIAWQCAAALGMGLLIGMERERTQNKAKRFAGVRTFTLVALLGAISVLTANKLDYSELIGLMLAAVAALSTVSYFISARQGRLGSTTEISILITFLIGCLCAANALTMAAALTVTTMLILALKDWLHNLARQIEPDDLRATIKFAIITLIVLPILPDQYYGPEGLKVLNPYQIWLMVVLIAGLNFIGYVLIKILGREHGLGLTGLLGGLVSSTALTLSFAQRSKQSPQLSPLLALSILLAWTVMFVRVLVVVAVVNITLLPTIFLPILWLIGISLLISAVLWHLRKRSAIVEIDERHNPFELTSAIKFGLLFGFVILLTHVAQQHLGDTGSYLVGAIAGLTDVDAITLSMANLAEENTRLSTASRTILIAVLANTFLKSQLCVWSGAPALRRIMIPIILIFFFASILAFVLL